MGLYGLYFSVDKPAASKQNKSFPPEDIAAGH